ncbi:MAG TPA: PDZ domain-containing protein, partial [Leucothrix sp.]|nr:PDZ domain-containing protein [Leucothrix sp.]
EVMKEGPAKGILQQGDIVLEFDGKLVDNASALPVLVGSTSIDKPVDIKVKRGESLQILTLKLAELPTSEELDKKPIKRVVKPKKQDQVLGMVVTDLNEAAKEALEIDGGVLVKHVKGNPAYKAGVEPGDVLRSLNKKKIINYEHFLEISLSLQAGKNYPLLILRNGASKYLALKVNPAQKEKSN